MRSRIYKILLVLAIIGCVPIAVTLIGLLGFVFHYFLAEKLAPQIVGWFIQVPQRPGMYTFQYERLVEAQHPELTLFVGWGLLVSLAMLFVTMCIAAIMAQNESGSKATDS